MVHTVAVNNVSSRTINVPGLLFPCVIDMVQIVNCCTCFSLLGSTLNVSEIDDVVLNK